MALHKAQIVRVWDVNVLVPFMLWWSARLILEFRGTAYRVWLYVACFVLIHAIATFVYNQAKYERIKAGEVSDFIPYIRYYDVLIVAPVFVWFGRQMMGYWRTRSRFMYLLSGLAIVHGVTTFLYNGYNEMSQYFNLSPVELGGVALMAKAG